MPISEVGAFTVNRLQILDEQGLVDKNLEPRLPPEKLILLYKSMCLTREADGRMLKLQRQGRLGTFPPCTGQEAAACGPALAMMENDWFVGAFRDLGLRLMRGMSLAKYFLYHNGFEEGNLGEGNPRDLPSVVPIATHIPHAVGIAYAMQYRKEKAAVIAMFGDGATSEGDFHEAINFAAVWKSPVVFICQNNHWAISVPLKKQMLSKTIAQKAIAYGVPGIQVDGNDALAMYQATKDALERAYRGEGPTLIEADTYRLLMHTTADDPKKYRTDEEVREWWLRDPIPRFRKYLESKNLWDDAKQSAMEQEIKERIERAVTEFERISAQLPPDIGFEHVFGTPHPEIQKQHEEFLRILPLQKEESHG
jgi:pyruvate dehydrogenase E1 component alpha subunit